MLIFLFVVFLPWFIYTQGRPHNFGDFAKILYKIGLRFEAYELVSFKLGMKPEMPKALHFDTSMNDLDLHSRSQGYEKFRTHAVIVL